MPRPKRSNSSKAISAMKPMSVSGTPAGDSPTVVEAKARKAAKKKVKKHFEQSESSVGLLVTEELESAIARCKARVETISASCRADNQKFTDEEFDLAGHREACLWGLVKPDEWETQYSPEGVMRVSEIYEKPVFFEDGASSSDIKQGQLGNCWFLSGLAVVATVPGLMEKICVARDELVGVYGFIFFRDGCWEDVIIDDQLFVNLPSYEYLPVETKAVYQHNPDVYDTLTRRGSNILYYGKSSSNNETWVPLIEKAYAKFYGNYAYTSGGYTMHAMEDLTGGVCRGVHLKDVLDIDRLWDEISKSSDHSKLYACGSIQTPDFITSQSLVGGHAYAVLRTTEFRGKRFLVIRNPWGDATEWNGRWSDNSKEWTPEWLPALTILNHRPGQDGQFIMEYSDFMKQWPRLDVTRIFDTSWVSSCIWVELPGMVQGQVATWGDVSFTITVPEHTESIIALQEVESRSFKEISGFLMYDLAFVVFKKGSTQEVASSQRCMRWLPRGQRVEVPLEAGEYVVHVRISPEYLRDSNYIEVGKQKWDAEVFRKLYSQRTAAYSKAMNYSDRASDDLLPTNLESVAGFDLNELERRAIETKREEAQKKQAEKEASAHKKTTNEVPPIEPAANINGTTTVPDVPVGDVAKAEQPASSASNDQATVDGVPAETSKTNEATTTTTATATAEKPAPDEIGHNAYCNLCDMYPITGPRFRCINDACPDFDLCRSCFDKKEHNQTHEMVVFSTPKQVIHPEVCSTCKASPIVGTLFVCTDEGCTSQISCATCFFKGHNTQHPILMAREVLDEEGEPETDRPVHAGITCSYCGMNPIVGTRYKCMHAKCPKYNLCEDCINKGIHDATHTMQALKTPEEAEYLHPEVSDGSPLVLGLRVYTKKSAKVTLKAQLKHGSLARQ